MLPNNLLSDTLDRKETDKRLEALEKSLQAASASIIATQPWQQQETKKEEIRRFETRTFETKQEQFHKEAVSSVDINSYHGYPRSMSPVWDNIPTHVSCLTFPFQFSSRPRKVFLILIDS